MRTLRRLDFVTWLLLTRPCGFVRLMAGWLRQAAPSARRADHVGRLAERHAYTGINDLELVRLAEHEGMEVLVHERYCDARLAVVRLILTRLNWPSSFDLLLRRLA